MRVKTDAKRAAIIAVATDLFREVGYERASMAEIATRVGGSKATLYNYFPSKEELFAVAMMDAMEERGEELSALLDSSHDDVRQVLTSFGMAYLPFITAPDALAMMRTAVAEGANSELGRDMYRRGPKRGWLIVADYLARLQQRGVLDNTDPAVMGAHLKALFEAGTLEPRLFGAEPEFSVDQAVSCAVSAFLRVYSARE
ncbi:TetR/AcrR family transcriptional regulator [Croceibacterium xixiisoli]|nr:TetR/AcrR family transcriptional regulator [Croceibacterium xixiisoli]